MGRSRVVVKRSHLINRVIQFSEVGEFRVYSHLVINDFEGRWEYDRFVSSLDRSVG